MMMGINGLSVYYEDANLGTSNHWRIEKLRGVNEGRSRDVHPINMVCTQRCY